MDEPTDMSVHIHHPAGFGHNIPAVVHPTLATIRMHIRVRVRYRQLETVPTMSY